MGRAGFVVFSAAAASTRKFAPSRSTEESSAQPGHWSPPTAWYAIAKIAGIELCRPLRQSTAFDAINP